MPAPHRTFAALSLACVIPALAAAQARVHGTVRDSLQGTPLALVEVLVAGTDLTTTTDAQGRYAVTIPLGLHTLNFRRVGYHPVSRQVRLFTADSVRVDVVMLDQAQRLDSVVVVAPAPPRTWPPGLEERMKDGYGRFITDSVLRRFEHTTLSVALQQRVAGIRFRRYAGRTQALGRGGCPMAIRLDGVLIYRPIYRRNARGDFIIPVEGPDAPPDLERLVTMVSLEAVEVYMGSGTPGEFRSDGSACGVIVLWSRSQRN